MATQTITLTDSSWTKLPNVSEGTVIIISHVTGAPIFIRSAPEDTTPEAEEVGHRLILNGIFDLNSPFGPGTDEAIYVRVAGNFITTKLAIESGVR